MSLYIECQGREDLSISLIKSFNNFNKQISTRKGVTPHKPLLSSSVVSIDMTLKCHQKSSLFVPSSKDPAFSCPSSSDYPERRLRVVLWQKPLHQAGIIGCEGQEFFISFLLTGSGKSTERNPQFTSHLLPSEQTSNTNLISYDGLHHVVSHQNALVPSLTLQLASCATFWSKEFPRAVSICRSIAQCLKTSTPLSLL